MKRVTINAYQTGLVFKNGVYQRLLTEGKYWLGFGEKAEVYDRTQPFTPGIELNLLLQDAKLKEALHVVEVKDNEIVLQYENGLLKQVLTAGRYTYWKDIVTYEFISDTLGVRVAGFGIRDIILPGDVKEIMNQVLVAEKKAQANIVMRREETASTRSLLNTAKLMEDNPMLFKLKEMEYVEKIAEKVSTISVNGNGVLIDQLRQIFGGGK